jgi:hypothetical protein
MHEDPFFGYRHISNLTDKQLKQKKKNLPLMLRWFACCAWNMGIDTWDVYLPYRSAG